MSDHCRLCHNTGRIYDGHASDYTPGAESWSLCGCRMKTEDTLPVHASSLSDLLNDCAAKAAEWALEGWRCLNPKPRNLVPMGGAYSHTLRFIRRI